MANRFQIRLRILVHSYSLWKCLTTTILKQRTTFKHLCLFCANITNDSLKPLHLDCISQAAFWIKNDKSQKIGINSSRKCRANKNSYLAASITRHFLDIQEFGMDDNIYLIIVPFAIHLRDHFIIYLDLKPATSHNSSIRCYVIKLIPSSWMLENMVSWIDGTHHQM